MKSGRILLFWPALLIIFFLLGSAWFIVFPSESAMGLLLASLAVILLVAISGGRGNLTGMAALLLFAASIYMTYVRNDPSFLVVSLLCAMIGVTAFATRSRPSMENVSPFMLTLFGFLLVFGLRGLQLLASASLAPWALSEALWYANLGFALFLVGYGINIGKTLGMKIKLPGQGWSEKRIRFAFVICAILGILCYWLAMKLAEVSSYSEALSNIMVFRFRTSSGGAAYVLYGMEFLFQIATVLLFIDLLRQRKIGLFSTLKFVTFFVLVCALFLPFGERGMFILLVGGLSVVFNFLKRRIKAGELLVGGLLLVVCAGGYARYRLVGSGWSTVQEAVGDLAELDFPKMFMDRLDALDKFVISLQQLRWQPSREDPSSFFVGILLRPIPRSLDPAKQLDTGSKLTSLFFPEVHGSNINFEFSILGEMYFYFSIFGIIFGMILFGILVRILETYFERNFTRADFQLHYSLILGTPIAILMGGFDSSGTINLLYSTVFCWAVLWYVSRGVPHEAARGEIVLKGQKPEVA